MNLNLDPKVAEEIKAQLAAEASGSDDNPLAKAMESAHIIRENLIAIKGESFARLVEIGVLVHKQMALNAFITQSLVEADVGFSKDVRKAILDIQSTIFAHMMNHACHLQSDDPDASTAESITEWVDRIKEAEDSGVSMLKNLIKKGEDE